MRLLVVIGMFWLTHVSAAEERPTLSWLKTVAFAAHQTDYSGIFVYQYDGRVETSRITHLVEADGEYEKIESLDGAKREVIRHHGKVWFHIRHKMVQVDGQLEKNKFPAFLPAQLSAINKNYTIKEAEIARLAGFNTQAIEFVPKDTLRYSRKIWADTGSGLLLKATVSDKNQIVEQYSFTDLKLGTQADRSLIDEISAEKFPEHKMQQAPIVHQFNSGWVVDALPAGFKKITELQRPMPGKHAPVIQLVFSDGLSGISVFIEPNDADGDDVHGLTSRGSVNMYRKVTPKFLFTVVGEIPARAVLQVLDSLRYNKKL